MNRVAWLTERKKCIGASDVAAVLNMPGVPGARGPLSVYMDKTSEGFSDFDNRHMRVGRKIEGAIAEEYQIETLRPVHDLGGDKIQKASGLPYIGATLDRVTSERVGGIMVPLELKHLSRYDCTPEKWELEPMLAYQAQLQIQMLCTGAQWGSLAALFPGVQLAYKDIERDDNFLDWAVPELEKFWKMVENREPPAVSTPNDLDAIKQIWEKESPKMISLPSETTGICDLWMDARERARNAEKDSDLLEAKLRERMKDASIGELPGGGFLTLKTVKKKGHTVAPSEYRQLRFKRSFEK